MTAATLTPRALAALQLVKDGKVRYEQSPTPLRRSTTCAYIVHHEVAKKYGAFQNATFERLLKERLIRYMNTKGGFGCFAADVIITDKGEKALEGSKK